MKLDSRTLLKARLSRGWTQLDLSKKSGVTVPTICRAERGHNIFPGNALHICKALKLELEEVMLPIESNDAA